MGGEFFVSMSRPWFRSGAWPEGVPKYLEFPEKPLDSIVRDAAERWPDKPAAWFSGAQMTYAEYDRLVDRLAESLHNLGIRKGDVVALLLPNSFQYMVSYYAAVRIGAIVTGVNPTYKPLEVKHQLTKTHAKALIFLDILYEDMVAPIRSELRDLKLLIGTNIADLLPWHMRVAGRLLKKAPSAPLPPDAIPYRSLLKSGGNPPHVDIDVRNDPALYIMTGGTTGVPKAAVLTHFNVYANALQIRAWATGIPIGVSTIGILPFFHAFGMTAVMNMTALLGGRVILFAKPPKMPELFKVIKTVTKPKEVIMFGVEVLYQRMADSPELDHYDVKGHLLMCVSGAGALHRPVWERFTERLGTPLVEGYGLSEASPVVCVNPIWPKDGEYRLGPIGIPLPGTDWRIVDPADPSKDLGTAEGPDDHDHIGELIVSGPQVMKEYLDAPEETSGTIVEIEGRRWLLTGDIGYMNERGEVTLLDRKKELIKVKGFSVFPTEVEELIHNHPAVYEVTVAGLPDRETGEAIKAWVVLKPEYRDSLTEEDFLAWCRENLTHYKVPKYVEFIDEIPKNAVGKVLRRVLVENDPLYISNH